MKTLQYKFVEFMPDELEEGILYVSIPYSTAIHKCVCGCGNEVVTPLSPIDWELTFDGKSVSLYPSIGNWNFKCKSHYWIIKNKVRHSRLWDKEEIEKGRKKDTARRKLFFKKNSRNRL